MFFIVTTYNKEGKEVFRFEENSLYSAFVKARIRSSGTDEHIVVITDTHGQIINTFKDGVMEHGNNTQGNK